MKFKEKGQQHELKGKGKSDCCTPKNPRTEKSDQNKLPTVKSPSDTTIYALALQQGVNFNSPILPSNHIEPGVIRTTQLTNL